MTFLLCGWVFRTSQPSRKHSDQSSGNAHTKHTSKKPNVSWAEHHRVNSETCSWTHVYNYNGWGEISPILKRYKMSCWGLDLHHLTFSNVDCLWSTHTSSADLWRQQHTFAFERVSHRLYLLTCKSDGGQHFGFGCYWRQQRDRLDQDNVQHCENLCWTWWLTVAISCAAPVSDWHILSGSVFGVCLQGLLYFFAL